MTLLKYQTQIFHFLFCLLLIGLPFSKALVSIAFVGLVLLTIISAFLAKESFLTHPKSRKEIIFFTLLPIFLYLILACSLFYSKNWTQGVDRLLSNIELLLLPIVFLVHKTIVQKQLVFYLKLFVNATSIATFITFIFFLLPNEIAQNIAESVPLLKTYTLHEKELAFGIYSPFTERLQFSYVIGVAILVQCWRLFKGNFHLLQIGQLCLLLGGLLILGARGAQIGFLVASSIWISGFYFKYLYPIFIKKVNAFFSYGVLGLSLIFLLLLLPLLAYQKVPAVKIRYEQMQWELGTFQDGTFKQYDYTHFTSIRRLLSWKNSWQLIKKQPILGVGIGDYHKEMQKAYAKDGLGFPVNTQSQFLYFWATAGILGLLIFLGILGYTFFHFFSKKTSHLRLLGLSFVVFYSLLFLFDAPLNFQVGSMTFLTFYGILAVSEERIPIIA